jgi:hypothetical protein
LQRPWRTIWRNFPKALMNESVVWRGIVKFHLQSFDDEIIRKMSNINVKKFPAGTKSYRPRMAELRL